VTGISDEAMNFLRSHTWPGNVRELINALEFAVVTCEGDTVVLTDLPYGADTGTPEGRAPAGALVRLEQNEILRALEKFRGNKTRAAEYLGINRKTLREKMQKYGL
jgi:DNA-binding NtrC family response regulator